mgnify:CR=1 FL=1
MLMTPVGSEPTQLALVELESTPLDHSGKLSSRTVQCNFLIVHVSYMSDSCAARFLVLFQLFALLGDPRSHPYSNHCKLGESKQHIDFALNKSNNAKHLNVAGSSHCLQQKKACTIMAANEKPLKKAITCNVILKLQAHGLGPKLKVCWKGKVHKDSIVALARLLHPR